MATIIKNSAVHMKGKDYDRFMDKVYQKNKSESISHRAKETAKRISAINNLKINGFK